MVTTEKKPFFVDPKAKEMAAKKRAWMLGEDDDDDDDDHHHHHDNDNDPQEDEIDSDEDQVVDPSAPKRWFSEPRTFSTPGVITQRGPGQAKSGAKGKGGGGGGGARKSTTRGGRRGLGDKDDDDDDDDIGAGGGFDEDGLRVGLQAEWCEPVYLHASLSWTRDLGPSMSQGHLHTFYGPLTWTYHGASTGRISASAPQLGCLVQVADFYLPAGVVGCSLMTTHAAAAAAAAAGKDGGGGGRGVGGGGGGGRRPADPHPGTLTFMSTSSMGEFLVLGSDLGVVSFVDAAFGGEIWTHTGAHLAPIVGGYTTPQGHIMTMDAAGTVCMFACTNGENLGRMRMTLSGVPTVVAMDEEHLVAAGDGFLEVFRLAERRAGVGDRASSALGVMPKLKRGSAMAMDGVTQALLVPESSWVLVCSDQVRRTQRR